MPAYDPIKARLRWTTKLKHTVGAARSVLPKDEAVAELARSVNGLHLAIAGEADETVEVLIARCRAAIAKITPTSEDATFVVAFKADARRSLNRAVNMIRRNYPSADTPKELAGV